MSGHTRCVPQALISDALAPLRADRRHAAILLDIDGTLAPIVEHAADASVPTDTRRLLIAISRQYGTVACVSGRQASEARAMVGVGTISYLGSHGSELLRAGWTDAVLDPAVAPWAERIAEFRRREDSAELRRVRVRIEDKRTIVAFHWRGAPNEQAAADAVARIAAAAVEAGLVTHFGRKVLEVRPPVNFDKGAGIASFLEGTEIRAALFAGDDVTDLDAFRGLTELINAGRLQTAVRVGVRSDEGPPELTAQADVVVDGIDGVRRMLEALAGQD